MIDTERIKHDHPLIEMVEKELGEGVKRGKWLFWCCPFHGEQTPSFGINTQDPDNFKCFGCGKYGDIFTWASGYYGLKTFKAAAEFYNSNALDPVEQAKLHADRAERAAKRAEESEQRMLAAERRIAESQPWLAYRGYMDDYAVNLWWENYGLDKKWQDFYMLGYGPQFYLGPSLTIPYFLPDGSYKAVDLVHRILGATTDKYRHEIPDLPRSFFYANNRLASLPPVIRMTEGEIKAMVLGAFMADNEAQTIGVKRHLGTYPVEQLDSVERINYYPDPGVPDDELADKADILGRDRTYIIRPVLGMKVDDALRKGLVTAKQLRRLELTAVRI